MKRIVMMVLRNLIFVPYGWIKLCYYASHVDKYTEEERYRLLKYIDSKANKGGSVHIEAHGVENIPKENGFMFFPNHQGLYDVLAIIDACPVPFSVVAKKEIGNIPFLKQVFACMKAYLIDRDDVRQAMQVIIDVHPMCTEDRALLNDSEFQAIKESDLSVLIAPYLIIGLIIVAMLLLIRFVKMPKNGDQNHRIDFFPTLKRIFTQTRYREGVIAQFFYVGAQIMCWTFIIQYGTRLFMSQGMDEKSAEVLSQQYNIIAMVIFCISRFICTFILRYLNAGKLLMILAIFGGIFTLGVIFLQNIFGMYCLVAVSACMSLMFPTIYGIALKGMGDDAKFGAAGLIMAILGGSVLPPLQASIIDLEQIAWLPAVNVSFILPFICFLVIIGYGYRTVKRNW